MQLTMQSATLGTKCLLLTVIIVQAMAQNYNFRCRNDHRYIDDHNYPDDWHLIVDSYDYEDLFEDSNSVWELSDVDGDGREWGDTFGGTCQKDIGIGTCNSFEGQNNWFFTGFNSYGAAVEVFIDTIYRWTGCPSGASGGCSVTVNRYDTNERVALNQQTNINRYTPIVSGGSQVSMLPREQASGDAMFTLQFTRPSGFSHLYLGFQDQGTCGQIKRFQTYYKICRPNQLQQGRPLVRFNEVALPLKSSTSPRMEDAMCTENAEPISSMAVRAYGNGTCTTNAQCACKGGYKRVNDSLCEACLVGTYRSFMSDNNDCESCPPNSMAPLEAASQCNCTNGYYRASGERVSEKCTKPPSKPNSLGVAMTRNNSITVTWRAPASDGERDDIYYSVEYEEVGSLNGFMRSNTERINTNSYTINGLKPVTTYIVRVIAENGVSSFETSQVEVERRATELVVTTAEGLPGCPSEFKVVDNIIALWQPPEQPNGNISGYEINIQYIDDGDTLQRVDPLFFDSSSFFYVLRKGVVPENVTATIQIRANTSAGYGVWCEGLEFADPPPPTGFTIGSTTYPSTLDSNANYLHDPSQGSPSSPTITCPLPIFSNAVDIQWTLTDLILWRNHTLSMGVCPCDIGGGVLADVITDGSTSSVVFGPTFPDKGQFSLSCSVLTLEHSVTIYSDNPLLEIQNFDTDDMFILLDDTQRINMIVLGLFTIANGVTQVATSMDDYMLEVVERNGSTRVHPISSVLQDPSNTYTRKIVIELSMSNSASMNFVLTLQQGTLTASKPFTVITQECVFDEDIYGVSWPATPATITARQLCGRGFIGNASRVCSRDAIWGDVLGCENVQIANVVDQVESLFENNTSDSDLVPQVLPLVGQLSNLTTPVSSQLSLLPRDLEDVSMTIAGIVELLVRNGEPITEEDAEEIVMVISNLLEGNNEPGVRRLQQRQEGTTFSQDLLNTAEEFGLYLAMFLEGSGMNELFITTNNIVLDARSVTLNDTERDDFLFSLDTSFLEPTSESFNNTSQVNARIPYSLLEERANENGVVPVVNMLIRNLEEYLPSLENDNQTLVTSPVSVILSSQVAIRNGPSESLLLESFTANFTLDNQPFEEQPFCAFWNFSDPIGNGSWSTTNVQTEAVLMFNDTILVQCSSTHLTSFAILVNVDVAGDVQVLSNEALRFVSYIGLGISLVCLGLTIIFFLSYGKQLFIAVHNFVHLNLAIALFLADLVFALGVQLAAKNEAVCKTVAALLHYLFLSVFCWMLCEGVMIYLLLWVVFSGLAKKWWFFLLLGWLPPLAFVIIGLASVLDQYGVRGENDELQFCWLSSGNGNHAIWTFVAPMLAVIIINTVFLVLALVTVIKNRCGKGQRSEVQRSEVQNVTQKKGKKFKVAIAALKASVILLPLLGLTWVIGLFTVNANTIVFAWVFTILNTLQGVFIFYFHVFRSEKVSDYLRKKFNSLWKRTSNDKTMSSSQLKSVGNSSSSGLQTGTLEKTNQEPEKIDLTSADMCESPGSTTGDQDCNHGDDNKLNGDIGDLSGEPPSFQLHAEAAV